LDFLEDRKLLPKNGNFCGFIASSAFYCQPSQRDPEYTDYLDLVAFKAMLPFFPIGHVTAEQPVE
jgi:hypothetical protein